MKKIIYFVCLCLLVILFASCSRITNMIDVDKEKIGAEYTGMEEAEIVTENTHGMVKNYKSSFNKNIWTVEFDYMNATGYEDFNIDTDDELLISSKVDSGEVWVKITQGDLSLSEIQKVQVIPNKENTVDLSQWKNGEIIVWLVVENGEDGLIQIEHMEN